MPPAKESSKAAKAPAAKASAAKAAAAKKTTKHKRTPKRSYSHFINKVLKQVHPGTGISKKSMEIMDNLMHDMFERLASTSKELIQIEHKPTLQVYDIQQAVKLTLPGELSKHGVSEGTKAYQNYQMAIGKEATKP